MTRPTITPLFAHKQYVTDKASFRIADDGSRWGDTPNIGMDAGSPELARVIAAAPDLFRLLAFAVERIRLANAEGDPTLSAWLPEAEAVIAKAEYRE